MTPGVALAVAAFLLAGAVLGHYARAVRAVRVPKRPRAHQAGIGLAAVLAAGALAHGPGLVGGALAVLVLVPAALFLFLTTQSGLPPGRLAVAVGAPAIDFEATDSEGRAFALSSLRGQRILLKFFRGHW